VSNEKLLLSTKITILGDLSQSNTQKFEYFSSKCFEIVGNFNTFVFYSNNVRVLQLIWTVFVVVEKKINKII